MIKLYSENCPIQNTEEVNLFPLLKKVNLVRNALTSYYSFTDTIDTCDYLIIPVSVEYLYNNNHTDYIKFVIKNAKMANKRVLLFSTGDFGTSIKEQNIITIRLGGFKSKQYGKTYIMSPFIKDPYDKLNISFDTLTKNSKPSIGFVGHSNKGFFKLVKEFLIFMKGNLNRIIKKDNTDFQTFYPSSYFRAKYLSSIQRNKKINTNFVFRKKYRAGAISAESRKKTTEEFFKNISENQYTFCMRGSGNFSVRFYETLAMGRIPILLNTDCDLPFNDRIDWNKHCVIIENFEANIIIKKIIDFHNNHDLNSFKTLQIKNRQLWIDFFQKDNYFIKLYENLK